MARLGSTLLFRWAIVANHNATRTRETSCEQVVNRCQLTETTLRIFIKMWFGRPVLCPAEGLTTNERGPWLRSSLRQAQRRL